MIIAAVYTENMRIKAAGPVEEEVFENERFLPFRGWGHQWPGHLLPTDRVGHWSLRGDGPTGAQSMEFHQMAPPLPEVRLRLWLFNVKSFDTG